MEVKTAIKEALKELIIPELAGMKSDIQELKSIQQITNKRLDDLNAYVVDLSRRVDQVRTELNERIDTTNNRIDQLRAELNERIDSTNARIDQVVIGLGERIDKARDELHGRIDQMRAELTELIGNTRAELIGHIEETHIRIDTTNTRLDKLYEVIVRREEHESLERSLENLEVRVQRLEQKAGVV